MANAVDNKVTTSTRPKGAATPSPATMAAMLNVIKNRK